MGPYKLLRCCLWACLHGLASVSRRERDGGWLGWFLSFSRAFGVGLFILRLWVRGAGGWVGFILLLCCGMKGVGVDNG